MNTVTQYGGSYCGKSGSYSAVSGPSLLLPVDRMEPVSEKLVPLGCELASDVYSEAAGVRDSAERANSGDSVLKLTKVCLEPACRRLDVSRGTSGSGSGSDPSVFPMKIWIDPITGFNGISVRAPSRIVDAELSTSACGDSPSHESFHAL